MAKQRKNPVTGCRPQSLFGLWFIEPERLESMRERVAAMDLAAMAREHAKELEEGGEDPEETRADVVQQSGDGGADAKPYLVRDGVAVITISGPTTKYTTSFQRALGGTSTILTERLVRLAKNDPDVKRMVVHLEDAPGGTVAGAYELRDTLREFAKVKPIDFHITDLGASAAYLFASSVKGAKITANATAFVGSIGTRSHLIDTSERAAKDGVRVIPIAAGKFKAAGLPGTKITDEHIAEAQKNVDTLNEMFINSVCEGRELTPDAVSGLEARTFIASDARERKLIDGVCTFDAAMADAVGKAGGKTGEKPEADNPHDDGSKANMELLQELQSVWKMDPKSTQADVIARAVKVNTDLDAAEKRLAALPKQPDAEALEAHLETAIERIDLAVDKGTLPPTTAATFKKNCGWVDPDSAEGKAGQKSNPSPFWLTKSESTGGKRPIDYMLAQFAATGVTYEPGTGEKSGKQKPEQLEREVPGGKGSGGKGIADDKNPHGLDAETLKQMGEGAAVANQFAATLPKQAR